MSQDFRGTCHQSFSRGYGYGCDQLGINDGDSYITMQVNNAAHPCYRVSQIKSRTDVRERQDRGLFNDSTTINFRMALHRAAASNHRARANARHGSDESRCKNTRTFFNHGAGSSPYSGSDFFACRTGLRLAGEDIDGKLPQVARVGQQIQVSFMLKKRTLTAAVRQLCTEQRGSVIPARGADAENFQLLLVRRHLRNAFLAI